MRVNSFTGDSLLGDPFKDIKFDWLAANPPYLRFERMDKGLDDYKKQLKKKYDKSLSDLYWVFIFLAKRARTAAYVIPSGFSIAPRGVVIYKKIKPLIVEHKQWDGKHFKGAAIEVSSIILRKGTPVEIVNVREEQAKVYTQVLKKISAQPRYAEVLGGITTGNNKKYVTSVGDYYSISGRNVRPWTYCDLDDRKKVLKSDFPTIGKYDGANLILRFYHELKRPGVCLADPSTRVCPLSSTCYAVFTPNNKFDLAIYSSPLFRLWAFCKGRQRWTAGAPLTFFSATLLRDSWRFPIATDCLNAHVDKMLANPEDKETEAEINKIVYQLYGLNEDEIKLVEEAVK